ncbi:MAG: hypothetical protein RLZZ501_358 [Pseudomonadota bacterium]|jgi:ferrochelatase
MNQPTATRTAVVLFNLGGPDSPEAVEPFLFNLFNDRAIIDVPAPLRWLIAKMISKRRAPTARDIYANLGGRSPLVEQTRAQARDLELLLGPGYRCFIAMRYWHPFTSEAVESVKAWGATDVVLLPLYPQFSATTAGSSLGEWQAQAKKLRMTAPTRLSCCYPTQRHMVAALADLVRTGHAEAKSAGKPRVLFSAHSLPKKMIDRGDPYQSQVEQTTEAVAEATGIADLDWSVCYQSRVGSMEWIGPSIESELERAGRDKVPVVVVPVAFVSEHSETLVELDIEYRRQAEQLGIPAYVRVPTLGCHPSFIKALAEVVRDPKSGAGKDGCSSLGRTCLGKGCQC